MKQHKILLLLLSTLLLVSCAGSKGSSSPLSSESTSSSTSSGSNSSSLQGLAIDATPESVYLALRNAGTSSSYRAEYPLGKSTYYDVLTPRYSYSSLTSSGQVLLPYYDSDTIDQDALYSYSVEGAGKVEIGSLLLGEENTFLTSLDSYNIFHLISDPKYKVTEDAFAEDESGIYSDDVIVILALAALTGHGMESLQGVFSRVRFSLSEEKPTVLGFDIQGKALDGSGTLVSFQTGEISQIGVAKEATYDSLLRHYPLPEQVLSEADVAPLKKSSLKANNRIVLHSGDEDPVPVLEQEISFDESHLLIRSTDSEQTSSHYYEKSGNDVVERGVDSENEPVASPMGVSFSDLSFPKDYLDPRAFRSEDGIHYHYFGRDASGFFYSLTYLPTLVPERIEAVKTEGSLTIHTLTEKEYSSSESITSYYDVVTAFSAPDAFLAPTAYPSDSVSQGLKPLLEKLSSGKQFRARSENLSGENTVTTLTVENGSLLKDVVRGERVVSRLAYQESEEGLFSFTVSEEGKVTKTGFTEGKKLSDILPTLGKGEVYEKSGENAYALKKDVIGLKNFFGGALLPYALPATVRLFYKENTITRLYYRYSFNSDGKEIQGAEAVDFDQYGTAKIPAGIRSQMNKLIEQGA